MPNDTNHCGRQKQNYWLCSSLADEFSTFKVLNIRHCQFWSSYRFHLISCCFLFKFYHKKFDSKISYVLRLFYLNINLHVDKWPRPWSCITYWMCWKIDFFYYFGFAIRFNGFMLLLFVLVLALLLAIFKHFIHVSYAIIFSSTIGSKFEGKLFIFLNAHHANAFNCWNFCRSHACTTM